MQQDKLTMSFDPHTIEHLGIKMYSSLPNAIAELIANAYDAEANNVRIKLIDNDERSISVSDDGNGMSFDEINSEFLRIGRKRRETDNGMSRNNLRKVTGRKGLGKLAFFGIGDIITITTKKDGEAVSFTLSWPDLISCTTDYEPAFAINACDPSDKGTIIELKSLKRKSPFDVEALAGSLSRLFSCFDDSFRVSISINDEEEIIVNDRLKFDGISPQIEWTFPEMSELMPKELLDWQVSGKILATEKPLKPGLRGITLYAHGRLVNAPEFYGVGESSHGYSYLTGWLAVDFIDEQEEDYISTDRQSLNWDLPLTASLRESLQSFLRNIEKDWREKRKVVKEKRIAEKTKVNVTEWYNKLPEDVAQGVERIVSSVVDDSELSGEKQVEVVGILHTLIPEYAKYHWRHIHKTVQDASYNDYMKADFYRSVQESLKRYNTCVQAKTGSNKDGQDLMMSVFGKDKDWSVSSKYKKTDGSDFLSVTKENIEEGQKFMSAGMMSGVRNPLAHEEVVQLRDSGLFTEDDCLDILSLLSHLFRRLDDAIKVNP